MEYDFDVIVVGSGAGGGMAAYELARSGKQVLLVERGREFTESENFLNEQRMMIEMAAFDDREMLVNGNTGRMYIGGVLGGGTALYGSVLMRPSKEDFTPGKYYSQWLPREIWDWPIQYDDLMQYYNHAEELMEVIGDQSRHMLHIEAPEAGYPKATPELEPINQCFEKSLSRMGYQPFHLPFGIDMDICLRCPTCPGYYCPNSARANTAEHLIKKAQQLYGLTVLSCHECEKLVTNGKPEVEAIQLINRDTGTSEMIRANQYVIAAGAIGSPIILQKSQIKDSSDQLGRNFMYHAGAIVAGIFMRPTGASQRFVKQLGFTDLYFGTEEYPHKLGYAQMLPVPGYLTFKKYTPITLPKPVASLALNRMIMWAGAVEDLPQPQNRVETDENGHIRITHKFHAYDLERSRFFLQRLKEIYRKTGALLSMGALADQSDFHTAHQVGTARFGTDPKTSVLNPECRVHAYENLFVADGSFMPTSLGVAPALTIMANALRVADIIKKET